MIKKSDPAQPDSDPNDPKPEMIYAHKNSKFDPVRPEMTQDPKKTNSIRSKIRPNPDRIDSSPICDIINFLIKLIRSNLPNPSGEIVTSIYFSETWCMQPRAVVHVRFN
jgi:hypothetical protein